MIDRRASPCVSRVYLRGGLMRRLGKAPTTPQHNQASGCSDRRARGAFTCMLKTSEGCRRRIARGDHRLLREGFAEFRCVAYAHALLQERLALTLVGVRATPARGRRIGLSGHIIAADDHTCPSCDGQVWVSWTRLGRCLRLRPPYPPDLPHRRPPPHPRIQHWYRKSSSR